MCTWGKCPAAEEIQVLVSRLYKNLDISHKCMKSCNRLNGIVVEKFQEFVCKFLELKSRLWNKLPERKRENMYGLKGRQKSIRLPNRTMPRKASFQTIHQAAQQNYAQKSKFSNHFFSLGTLNQSLQHRLFSQQSLPQRKYDCQPKLQKKQQRLVLFFWQLRIWFSRNIIVAHTVTFRLKTFYKVVATNFWICFSQV